ncbi:MAG: alpha/beta fold hydrolase [Kofleriaceae bacterium]
MNLSKIFPFRRPDAAPRLRLVCLPFAGGAASVFHPWINLFGPAIEVCPVELPGRGVRMAEPPLRDMRRLCDALLEPLEHLHGGLPLALFGHSMGGRIAFELAQRLGDKVVHLFASGTAAPDVAPRLGGGPGAKPIAQLDDAEFLARLRELGGTPVEILEDEELMARVLPVVRADFVLVERYRAAPHAQVAVPLTVLRGSHDPGVSAANAERWQLRTSAAYRHVEVPGGHFFLEPQRAMVISEVLRDLAAWRG